MGKRIERRAFKAMVKDENEQWGCRSIKKNTKRRAKQKRKNVSSSRKKNKRGDDSKVFLAEVGQQPVRWVDATSSVRFGDANQALPRANYRGKGKFQLTSVSSRKNINDDRKAANAKGKKRNKPC